jgi:hypothetical protein
MNLSSQMSEIMPRGAVENNSLVSAFFVQYAQNSPFHALYAL